MTAPDAPELLEPVSELNVAKPELYERLLGTKLGGQAMDNIILGED